MRPDRGFEVRPGWEHHTWRSTMRVHLVVHEPYEGPGAFDAWVNGRGYDASFSRVHLAEKLPATTEGIDLLVVLGGPQSPSTSLGECPHFDSAAEQTLVYDAISAGAMVVGVCLGAQLIGASLGADCEQAEEAEIGVYPIRLTAAGAADPRLAGFAPALDVGHWHHDMPGLTAGEKSSRPAAAVRARSSSTTSSSMGSSATRSSLANPSQPRSRTPPATSWRHAADRTFRTPPRS